MNPRGWCLGLAALVLAGCGAGEPVASGAVVRDSAGVAIVENASPEWRRGEEWRLAAAPEVEIGVVEGESAYQLHDVVDAARLSDGRIVVLNAGTHELRYYDAEGRHLVSVGGEGGGPSEFRRPSHLFRLPGDSLLVVDASNQRLSLHDSEGRYVTSRRAPYVHGRLADGTLIQRVPIRDGHAPPAEGYARDSVALVRIDLAELASAPAPVDRRHTASALGDTIVRMPGGEFFRIMLVGDGIIQLMNNPAPYGRQHQLVVAGERIYTGTGDRYEIAVHRPDGTLERLIRRQVENRPVTGELVDRFRERALEDAQSDQRRRQVEQFLADAPFPETLPSYRSMNVDAAGNLWVERYRAPGEEPAVRDVFDPEGRWLGAVELPAGLRVLEIGEDYVLGVARDEFDVEYVRLYRIDKGRGSP